MHFAIQFFLHRIIVLAILFPKAFDVQQLIFIDKFIFDKPKIN